MNVITIFCRKIYDIENVNSLLHMFIIWTLLLSESQLMHYRHGIHRHKILKKKFAIKLTFSVQWWSFPGRGDRRRCQCYTWWCTTSSRPPPERSKSYINYCNNRNQIKKKSHTHRILTDQYEEFIKLYIFFIILALIYTCIYQVRCLYIRLLTCIYLYMLQIIIVSEHVII